jgi:hypothetical protein
MDAMPETEDKTGTDDTLEMVVNFETDGVLANNMLLTQVGQNLYRIEETPVLIDSVSYNDIMEADLQSDGSLLFRRVVKKAEIKTFDFVLHKEVVESERFRVFLDRVKESGGRWELIFGGWLLIHLPLECNFDPGQEIDSVYNDLRHA